MSEINQNKWRDISICHFRHHISDMFEQEGGGKQVRMYLIICI